jgi:hypothetical protein
VIRGLVDSAPTPRDLIVVSSDKALYSYARTRGARVLRVHEWSALERQARSTSVARPRGAPAEKEKPEREDDVAGWLKTFGEE